MFKVVGYLVEHNGNVINFSVRRDDAVRMCDQNALPHDCIIQVFKNVPMDLKAPAPAKEGVYVPDATGLLRVE